MTSDEGNQVDMVERNFWLGIADDPVQKVIYQGHLYIIFNSETMSNSGSALHRVEWRESGEFDIHRLIPQGQVPDWMRDRLQDNVAALEYLSN